MKKTIVFALLIATSVACLKKSTNTPVSSSPRPGTMTTTDSESATPRDLTGTWIATEGPRVWELVVTRIDDKTFAGATTLVSNAEKDGLIDYGPPGTKGDAIIIISEQPGKFRVRWAKAENYHKTEFWEGAGTYDDNSFDFPGQYQGKRKN